MAEPKTFDAAFSEHRAIDVQDGKKAGVTHPVNHAARRDNKVIAAATA